MTINDTNAYNGCQVLENMKIQNIWTQENLGEKNRHLIDNFERI